MYSYSLSLGAGAGTIGTAIDANLMAERGPQREYRGKRDEEFWASAIVDGVEYRVNSNDNRLFRKDLFGTIREWPLGAAVIAYRTLRTFRFFTTKCMVWHEWIQLPPRYYPRWFLETDCLDNPVCSAQQSCRTSASQWTTFDWYFCPKEATSKSSCRWLKRNLEVLYSCATFPCVDS